MRSLIYTAAALLTATALTTGCSTSVSSRTDRTAVEMALLSKTAERSTAAFSVPDDMAGKSFFLDLTQFKSIDQEWAQAQVRRLLLKGGMVEVAERDDADVTVVPSVAIAAMDENSFNLGVPEIPVPVPNAGTISTPEIALLARNKQMGLNRIGMYAINNDDGTLAHDFGTQSSDAYYSRWRILFFISFSVTDLEDPYRAKPL